MKISPSIVGLALTTTFVLSFIGACDSKPATTPTSPTTPTTPTSPTTPTTPAKPAPAPDNTRANKADNGTNAKTPMDQSNAAADIKITADIRKAILDDSTMSTNAQNCKIITDKSGMVTLRGVVNSQAEKDGIEVNAKAVAGVNKVDNQLEIKTN